MSEGQWQVGKDLQNRMVDILQNARHCDVTFVFPKTNPVATIPAHKTVLMAASPVFEAKFFGESPENSDDMEIEDMEPNIFKQILRYVYTDTAELDDMNVIPVLSASMTYKLEPLTRGCTSYLESKISITSVCTIFNASLCLNVVDLAAKCLHFIKHNTSKVIQTQEFFELNHDALCKILGEDELFIERESYLFRACLEWATRNSSKSEPDLTNKEVRDLLNKCLKQIRFCGMSGEEFSAVLSDKSRFPDILTADEQAHIFKVITGDICDSKTQLESEGFNTEPRKKPLIRIPLFMNHRIDHGLKCQRNTLIFCTNTSVKFRGVRVFVGKKGSEYDISLKIQDKTRSREGNPFLPEYVLSEYAQSIQCDGHSGQVDIKLNKSVVIDPGHVYIIELTMNGPPTFFFTNEVPPLTHEDITLELASVATHYRQIAEILLSRK